MMIRIGTRDSKLAMWQANKVQNLLTENGLESQIVPVKSHGDLVLNQPLYKLGIVGIFTKTLDAALLNNEIDIAVHSLKDVPTSLPEGIIQGAVLPRGETADVLVLNNKVTSLPDNAVIATGSLRRQAQWLSKYPSHSVVDLRGNIFSRLQKLQNNAWDGAIFAKAGLERMNLLQEYNFITLDWMLPAPSQGAISVCCRQDSEILEALQTINDPNTEICTSIERRFLKALEGGCSQPIGALATICGEDISFSANFLTPNGDKKAEIFRNFTTSTIASNPEEMAEYCRKNL